MTRPSAPHHISPILDAVPNPLSKPALRRYAVPAAAAVLVSLLAACGGGGDASSSTAQDSAQSPDQSSPTSNVTCDYPDAPQGATRQRLQAAVDTRCAGHGRRHDDHVDGLIGAKLDADKTPCTVNSFVSLAKQGFFDKTPCHRLTATPATIFVLQCGDPTGTGTGGPGYTIPDELSGNETYGPGTLAMAKTQQPNSGGSQFFIVYRNTPLPPNYTVFGQVDAAGLKAVRKVAKQGTDNAFGDGDGHPKVPVTIDSVTVG